MTRCCVFTGSFSHLFNLSRCQALTVAWSYKLNQAKTPLPGGGARLVNPFMRGNHKGPLSDSVNQLSITPLA